MAKKGRDGAGAGAAGAAAGARKQKQQQRQQQQAPPPSVETMNAAVSATMAADADVIAKEMAKVAASGKSKKRQRREVPVDQIDMVTVRGLPVQMARAIAPPAALTANAAAAAAAASSSASSAASRTTIDMDVPLPIKFAQQLAHNTKKNRDAAVKKLSQYLRRSAAFTDLDLLKVWKGIFYCYWMSDKPMVQQELADRITALNDATGMSRERFLAWVRAFWITMLREWVGLDRLRMDKFMAFVRKSMFHMLLYLQDAQWEITLVQQFSHLLAEFPLQNTNKHRGIFLHVTDLFVVEWSRLMRASKGGKSVPAAAAAAAMPFRAVQTLLSPFVTILTRGVDSSMVSRASDEVFNQLVEMGMKQFELDPREEKQLSAEEAAAKKAELCAAWEHAAARVFVREHAQEFAQWFFSMAADDKTLPVGGRNRLFALQKSFQELLTVMSLEGSSSTSQDSSTSSSSSASGHKKDVKSVLDALSLPLPSLATKKSVAGLVSAIAAEPTMRERRAAARAEARTHRDAADDIDPEFTEFAKMKDDEDDEDDDDDDDADFDMSLLDDEDVDDGDFEYDGEGDDDDAEDDELVSAPPSKRASTGKTNGKAKPVQANGKANGDKANGGKADSKSSPVSAPNAKRVKTSASPSPAAGASSDSSTFLDILSFDRMVQQERPKPVHTTGAPTPFSTPAKSAAKSKLVDVGSPQSAPVKTKVSASGAAPMVAAAPSPKSPSTAASSASAAATKTAPTTTTTKAAPTTPTSASSSPSPSSQPKIPVLKSVPKSPSTPANASASASVTARPSPKSPSSAPSRPSASPAAAAATPSSSSSAARSETTSAQKPRSVQFVLKQNKVQEFDFRQPPTTIGGPASTHNVPSRGGASPSSPASASSTGVKPLLKKRHRASA